MPIGSTNEPRAFSLDRFGYMQKYLHHVPFVLCAHACESARKWDPAYDLNNLLERLRY